MWRLLWGCCECSRNRYVVVLIVQRVDELTTLECTLQDGALLMRKCIAH